MCIHNKFEELSYAYSLLQDENALLLQENVKLREHVIEGCNLYTRENQRVQELEKQVEYWQVSYSEIEQEAENWENAYRDRT